MLQLLIDNIMRKVLISALLLCGSAFMAVSQEVDRDRSKYAVNNFADNDIYTMYEPYATVKVNEPDGRKVKNIILMIGDGMGLEQISAAWVCNGGSLNLDNFSKIGIQRTYSAHPYLSGGVYGIVPPVRYPRFPDPPALHACAQR